METGDERREVAATLRDAKRKCESRGYPWTCDDLCLAIGYERGYEADNGIFDRLADLIDPTCEVVTVQPDGRPGDFVTQEIYEGCSACGHYMQRDPFTGRYPHYCPNCGRRVVGE
jgi:hypothetical protein